MKPEFLHLIFAAVIGASGMGLFVSRKKTGSRESRQAGRDLKGTAKEETIESDLDVKQKAAEIIRGSDAEYRFFVSEIAGSITQDWRFRFQMLCGLIIVFVLGFWGVYTGLGWSIKDAMTQERKEVTNQIKNQFNDPNIKATLQDVASNEARRLIQQSIQPSINEFNQHLTDQKIAVDNSVAPLRDELEKLKKRNELTSLADQAIDNGDVSAYRRLRTFLNTTAPPEGAMAEFLRVFTNFSMLGPTQFNGVILQASTVHPGKTKEGDLDVTDLLLVLTAPQPAARARAAVLLATIGKPGSYSTAKALVQAIKNEQNLWVIKDLKPAFQHVVTFKSLSFYDGGGDDSPDGQNVLDWWKAHEDDVAKIDTDPKPSMPDNVPSSAPPSASSSVQAAH